MLLAREGAYTPVGAGEEDLVAALELHGELHQGLGPALPSGGTEIDLAVKRQVRLDLLVRVRYGEVMVLELEGQGVPDPLGHRQADLQPSHH